MLEPCDQDHALLKAAVVIGIQSRNEMLGRTSEDAVKQAESVTITGHPEKLPVHKSSSTR